MLRDRQNPEEYYWDDEKTMWRAVGVLGPSKSKV
jgi:hypothetical protein